MPISGPTRANMAPWRTLRRGWPQARSAERNTRTNPTSLQPLMVSPLLPRRLAASAGFVEKSRTLFRLVDEVVEWTDTRYILVFIADTSSLSHSCSEALVSSRSSASLTRGSTPSVMTRISIAAPRIPCVVVAEMLPTGMPVDIGGL